MRTQKVLLKLKQRARVRTRALALLAQGRERREELRGQALRGRYAQWRRTPVQDRTVFYESFAGNGALCNPEAIFRHLLEDPEMADLQHVWALDDLAKHQELQREFAQPSRVRFVERNSPEYFQALATARYLFNNATFGSDFVKRPDQIYVNTWHGVPLKHMGYDLQDGGLGSRNILRNFLAADYLLSANSFMTETMYRRAFRLDGLYPGQILEEGQPRTDRQLAAEREPGPVRRDLARAGIDPGGRKVILFAPTWKGTSFQQPALNARQLLAVVSDLQARVDSEKYVVLLKVHQVVYAAMLASGKGRDVLVPNGIPTNSLLGITDVLVTDYSSVCFDFLASRRPILHLVPDLPEYTSGRGLYLDQADLPGTLCTSVEEVAERIRDPEALPTSWDAVERFASRDDGAVCRRVVDVVFRGADPASYNVRSGLSGSKETLLVYLGSLASMGITSSALNLLKNLDYERFDVTAFFPNPNGRDRLKNARLIDPRARVLPRFGEYPAGPYRLVREKRLMSTGLPPGLDEGHQRFWADEWRRMFGASRFDYAVDLSGYGTFCPFLFGAAEGSQKSLWLHSDLMAESQRETAGLKHLEERLNAVFSTFRYFDHLVSVSAELERVNSAKLAAFAPPVKFTHASNTIDHQRVLTMAGLDEEGQPLHGELATVDTGNLSSVISLLTEHYEARTIAREARARARMTYVPRRDDRYVSFVAVGRLSPEKNHDRLIRAFARVHEQHPDTRLVILGDGRLMPQVLALVERLGLQEVVSIAGHVDNPYSIMVECDCFVISSDYEGQPMVVLEARTLDLPVVSTRFPSVAGSVPDGAGLIVEQSVDALAVGMQQVLAGEVPSRRLDWEAYNREAMRQFYRAIGADSAASPAIQ